MDMHAEHLRFGNCCAIAFLHDTCPQTAGRTEFSNFKEKVETGGKDPADTGGEIINLLTGFDGCINVSDGIRKRKRDFLYF